MVSKEEKIRSPIVFPEFSTHLNYVEYLADISKGLELICSSGVTKKIDSHEDLARKVGLVRAVVKNIEMEARFVNTDAELARVAISWTPIKAYYLIFNLTVLIEYLIGGDKNFLTVSHKKSRELLKSHIGKGVLSFNKIHFNEIKTGFEIDLLKVPKSDNLRDLSPFRSQQIFRKLFNYAKDDARRQNNGKRLSRNQMRELRNSKYTLWEFFYWYRIKTNYRDLEFIADGIPPQDFCLFHKHYYHLTLNFYLAYKECINKLSVIRIGREIL